MTILDEIVAYKRNEVLLTLTPEERYLKLLEVHPQIIQRVSLFITTY